MRGKDTVGAGWQDEGPKVMERGARLRYGRERG